MKVKIAPSKINGTVTAPPSKSVTHRAIICAALSSGKSIVKNILLSDDTKYTIEGLKSLGVKIKENKNTLEILGSGGNLTAPAREVFVGNSGSSLRMLTAISALTKGETVINGDKRLCQRPILDLLKALKTLGIKTECLKKNNCAPVKIYGGKIKGGKIKIAGHISSQYISSLLLISPFAKKPLIIEVEEDLKSKPYVSLTIEVMKKFGVKVENNKFKTLKVKSNQKYTAQNYSIEGDYSSASYFFAAAAVTNGSVCVKNLNPNSSQGDKYFLDVLKKMGCKVSASKSEACVSGTNTLDSLEIDMNDYPDIVQTTAVVASFAKGESAIKNINHLRFKESDRIETTLKELKKMNIKCSYDLEGLKIKGGKLNGATINTHNDHRIAMSFAIAGLNAYGQTIIENAQVVNKSYPNFFNDLKKIGGNIKVI